MISLFHDSSTSSETSIIHPKVSSPFKIRSNIQLIPKLFFNGLSIFIQIQDQNLYNKAKKSLEDAGAIIMTELPYMADYIVSEKQITIPAIRQQRTRGSRLVALASMGQNQPNQQNPKTILIKQIPWIFSTKEENEENLININQEDSKTKKIQNDEYDPNLVVIANGREAPLFLKMKEFPCLYFEKAPKGYNLTPFSPVRNDAELFVQIQRNHTPKPKDPPQPPKKQILRDWSEFDSISESLNENFFSF